MIIKSTLILNDLNIAFSFNLYFPLTLNSQTYPSSAPFCHCDMIQENIFDYMTIGSIHGKMLSSKSYGTVPFDNLPPLVVKLCRELFAYLLFNLLSAVIHTLLSLKIGKLLLLDLCKNQIAKQTLLTIGPLPYSQIFPIVRKGHF